MVLEFGPNRYVDVDSIRSLQWVAALPDKPESKPIGAVLMDGEKFFVYTKEEFDIIEKAYLLSNKSCMYDDKIKKIRWVRGE